MKLFLRWAWLNAVFVCFLIAAGVAAHGKFHGLTLVAIPAILVIYAIATAWGGLLCWRTDRRIIDTPSWYSASALLHDAEWLNRAAYACQMAGIISTMLGFYMIIYSAGSDFQTKLQGGAVALLGSFVGAICSIVVLAQQWLLEHELRNR